MRNLNVFSLTQYSIRVFCLVGALHLSAAAFAGATASHQSNFEIPLYEGAYQIQKNIDPISGFETVRYSVRLKPPAAEIIEFYDAFFNGQGWISSFEICQRHWDDSLNHSSGAGRLKRQMYTSWEHPDFDLKFVLWLKYDQTAKYGTEEVTVDGRLQTKTDG